MNREEVLYGAAYYNEYMPVERLETDMQMMVKAGINADGKQIRNYLNYFPVIKHVPFRFPAGKELLTGKHLRQNDEIVLTPWGTAIVEA